MIAGKTRRIHGLDVQEFARNLDAATDLANARCRNAWLRERSRSARPHSRRGGWATVAGDRDSFLHRTQRHHDVAMQLLTGVERDNVGHWGKARKLGEQRVITRRQIAEGERALGI